MLETSPDPPQGAAGERRHLPVLFCDLFGSTGIAAQLDPEEWRETVAGYQRAVTEAIARFGGHVAKYVGDGVMAFSAIRRLTTTTLSGRGTRTERQSGIPLCVGQSLSYGRRARAAGA